MAEDLRSRIAAANTEAVRRLNESQPVLVDVAPAGEVIPGLGARMILHAGPPVTWARMSGAQRGSVMALCLFEGWASSIEHAEAMLAAGEGPSV